MSNFACEKCGTICYDSAIGYVTGCEHYPPDNVDRLKMKNKCSVCGKPISTTVVRQCKNCCKKRAGL